MKKVPLIRRIGLKCLSWVLSRPEESQTHHLNALLYHRCSDGKWLENTGHPQIYVGAHTYGICRESMNSYHPDDRVVIGKYCSIADGVRFIFGEHRLDCVSTYPFKAMLLKSIAHADARSKGDIVIENDVWIGYGATILSGVHVGNGAVIAAGSVVTRDVAPYLVVGGVPAKIIKTRFDGPVVSALFAIKWWDWSDDKVIANMESFYGDVGAFITKHLPDAPSSILGDSHTGNL
jgi:acetyltransferase-like isoleucine patch superfamily enzyme